MKTLLTICCFRLWWVTNVSRTATKYVLVCGESISCNTRCAEHVIAKHLRSGTLKKFVLAQSVEHFLKTPLKDIVTQAHDNVASGDTLLGTSSDKSSDIIVVQDKNGHIYTDEYMFRLINCLAKCRLSVNQLINCSPEFQKVFFGQDHLSTPCHATISRAVDSVIITLKQLLLQKS